MRDQNLSDAIGLEIERRERPFHVAGIAAGETLAETIGPGAARAVTLNEAAERLNDALTMQSRIDELENAARNMVAACEMFGLNDLGFTMNCAVNILRTALQEPTK